MRNVKSFVLTRGIVQNNSDPTGDGRLKIYIPAIDSPSFETDDLPWAGYVSPFGGHTADFMAGPEDETIKGITTYGFWAIPKTGAQVLCGFAEGDSQTRFWMGCFYLPEHNHTLPAAISESGPMTEIDESGKYGQHKIPFQERNLKEAGLDETKKHFRTRGGWQRSVSYAAKRQKTKPTSNGYKEKPTDSGNSDSQIYSMTTPGRHMMVFSDVNDESRIRFKTAMGTQIILDDTNEKIYISGARGRNYIEFDEGSGKIHLYSSSKVNVHSENDINLFSDENINIVAKKRINIKSQERAVKIQAKMNVEALSEQAQFKVTASRDIVLKTTNGGRAEAVAEKTQASPPPYKGKPLGVIRDWAEEGGSTTSQLKIDIVENIDMRSNTGTIRITGKNDVDIRSMSNSIHLQGSKDIHLKSQNIKLQGSNIDVNAGSSLKLTGSDAHLKGNTVYLGGGSLLHSSAGAQMTRFGLTSYILNNIPVESLNNATSPSSAGSADTAAAAITANTVEQEPVVDKMIRPLHETEEWVRDEDESICKTPRNSKYKG